MKKVITASLLFFASLGTALAQDPGWPRQITKPQGTLVYYQPQVDNWNDFVNLDWRMAFSITPAGGKETVGAVTLHGLTSVKSDSQMVLISNLQIKNAYFPSLSPADAASMDQMVRTFVPPTVWISASSSYHPSGSEEQGMQQEAQNRDRGEQSSQRYSEQRSSGGWGHSGSGGGGWGEGGGGRRR